MSAHLPALTVPLRAAANMEHGIAAPVFASKLTGQHPARLAKWEFSGSTISS